MIKKVDALKRRAYKNQHNCFPFLLFLKKEEKVSQFLSEDLYFLFFRKTTRAVLVCSTDCYKSLSRYLCVYLILEKQHRNRYGGSRYWFDSHKDTENFLLGTWEYKKPKRIYVCCYVEEWNKRNFRRKSEKLLIMISIQVTWFGIAWQCSS